MTRDDSIQAKVNRAMKIRPLNRSMTIVCVAFFALLCLVLSIATYRIYTATMYDRYQKQLTSIVTYAEKHIDHDDMSECARTYVESEKYAEFQAFFDDLIDNYADVHYIYIMQVLDPEDPINIRSICSANSTYEKENDPDMVIHLGDGGEGWYDTETARTFRAIQDGDEDVFFLNPSIWGVDYTLARPLTNSKDEHYGLLCADVSVDELNNAVYRNIYINIAVIILAGILFIVMLLLWMRFNVTRPLKLLEGSVADFANTSTGRRDPDELVYQEPVLKVHNEVKSLSMAMSKLSGNMRSYVKGMIAAEDETRGLKTRVYEDALTKLKNKAAYDKKVESMNWDIKSGIAEFGIAMVDLNGLKTINDRYGHEHGNEFIIGSSHLICRVFKHSPVYRIGGDEFVAVVQGLDYGIRDKLCDELKQSFEASLKDESLDPWNRYSAAVGMSAYRAGDTVETVFERADQAMYEEKSRMKAKRI